MPDPSHDLATLRNRIAEVDREIAQAVLRRLDLAGQVAAAKSSGNTPVRNFEVEAQVVDRWRESLAVAGIPAARAEAFARWLVEESVRLQEHWAPERPAASAGGLSVAIVGGAGAMGQWMARFLEDGGHRVSVVDPRATAGPRPVVPDVATAARSHDVVIFATPIRGTLAPLEEALGCGARPLVFDILSVKAPIADRLVRAAGEGLRVTSVHPMFGPSARSLSGRNLLIVPCGSPESDRAARELFARSSVSIGTVPIAEHDRLIAESLGLAHAVNLLFLAALANDPLTPHALAQAASTTFHRQSALARAVAEEGPELYLDIQSLNPHSEPLYRQLHESLDLLQKIVEKRDLDSFTRLLREGSAKLEEGPVPLRS